VTRITDNTNKVLSEIDKRLVSKLGKASLMVERKAKELCPVLTGTLRRSIISNWYGAKGTRSVSWPHRLRKVKGKKVRINAGKTEISPQDEKKAVIGTNVEYAPYIELGTSKMAAQPYLVPALESCMGAIKRLFSTP